MTPALYAGAPLRDDQSPLWTLTRSVDLGGKTRIDITAGKHADGAFSSAGR
jgi:hypothetical protein